VWALLFAGVVTLIGGVPMFQMLRRVGRLNAGSHLVAGALLGLMPFVFLGVLGTARAAVDRAFPVFVDTLSRLAADAAVGAIAGASGALAFFLITSTHKEVRRRAA
jgi:hypothetical protein